MELTVLKIASLRERAGSKATAAPVTAAAAGAGAAAELSAKAVWRMLL